MNNNKGLVYFLFILVFFLTPNFPMPTSEYGPIAPLIYFGIFIVLFLSIIAKPLPKVFKNKYFTYLMFFQVVLLISDILKAIFFDFETEVKFIPIRVINMGVLFIYLVYGITFNRNSNLFEINQPFLKVYFYSVIFISIILYGQAFGIITFGEVYPARAYFGIALPFDKPVGLFELSDGKLGAIIAPALFLCLVNYFSFLSFFKIKFNTVFLFFLLIMMVLLQSRSGYLGLVISIVVFIILYPKKISKVLFYLGTLSFILLALFTNILQKVISGLTGEGIFEKNVNSRGYVLQNAFNKFADAPFFGVGHKKLLLYQEGSDHGVGTHNLFTDHIGSGGLLSFIALLMIFILFYRYALKLYYIAKQTNRNSILGFSIWIIVSMTHIVVELNFYRGLYNEYVFMFLALGVIAYLNYFILKNEESITYS